MISSKMKKNIMRDGGGGNIFWRQDEEGKYWIKAATHAGKKLMESYGLKPV